jgi:hypothetical protein
MAAYLRAVRTGRGGDYLLAGVLVGAALLSKYLAGLLALALCAHRLCSRAPDRSRGLALLVAGMLPAVAIQVGWNSQNCWPNLMFNLVNRHASAGWSLRNPVLYAISVVYVLGPPIAWWLLRPAGAPDGASATRAAGDRDYRLRIAALTWMTMLPLAALALLATIRTVGLHWLAAFVAPAIWLFAIRERMRRPALASWRMRIAVATLAAIALLHYAAIPVLAALPTERFSWWRSYPGLVLTRHGDEVIAALESWRGTHVWATDSYSSSVTLGFADRHSRDGRSDRVIVFGAGSTHARHDDILTDFRPFAGSDFLIVSKKPPHEAMFAPYFDRVAYGQAVVRGATFHLVHGSGFRYDAYRDGVLDEMRRRYYAVPAWLPAGPCYFCDRYFPDRSCRRMTVPADARVTP